MASTSLKIIFISIWFYCGLHRSFSVEHNEEDRVSLETGGIDQKEMGRWMRKIVLFWMCLWTSFLPKILMEVVLGQELTQGYYGTSNLHRPLYLHSVLHRCFWKYICVLCILSYEHCCSSFFPLNDFPLGIFLMKTKQKPLACASWSNSVLANQWRPPCSICFQHIVSCLSHFHI